MIQWRQTKLENCLTLVNEKYVALLQDAESQVLKHAARPTPYDNDERTWLEFRFKLENCLTLVNEKYVALLQDAESEPVSNVPAGTDESSVLIRTLRHTLRLVGDTDHRTKLETGTASTEQKRVRSLETVGCGKRTADSASRVAAGIG